MESEFRVVIGRLNIKIKSKWSTFENVQCTGNFTKICQHFKNCDCECSGNFTDTSELSMQTVAQSVASDPASRRDKSESSRATCLKSSPFDNRSYVPNDKKTSEHQNKQRLKRTIQILPKNVEKFDSNCLGTIQSQHPAVFLCLETLSSSDSWHPKSSSSTYTKTIHEVEQWDLQTSSPTQCVAGFRSEFVHLLEVTETGCQTCCSIWTMGNALSS